jgi:chemotaxis response regulator CheB
MIVAGASLGGVQAMQALLGTLPASWASELAVVLHRHRESDIGLMRNERRR